MKGRMMARNIGKETWNEGTHGEGTNNAGTQDEETKMKGLRAKRPITERLHVKVLITMT